MGEIQIRSQKLRVLWVIPVSLQPIPLLACIYHSGIVFIMLTLVNLLTMKNQRWLDSHHQHISVTVFFRATGWGCDVTATTSGDWQRDKSSTYSLKYVRLRRGEDKWAPVSEALTGPDVILLVLMLLGQLSLVPPHPIMTECRQVHPLLPQHTPGRKPL